MNFCPNCGKQITGNFCSNCGYSMAKPAPEKNGKGVASMVLGIIGVVWAALELLSLGGIEAALSELSDTSIPYLIGFAIGYNILTIPCGLIGLILGLTAKKDSKAKTGIITSAIALLVCLITFIYIFTI